MGDWMSAAGVITGTAAAAAVVCSAIRGNVDLIDEQGGALFDPHSAEACREAIATVLAADRAALGAYNTEKIKAFSHDNVLAEMGKLYNIV